jgi:hypothetical protein
MSQFALVVRAARVGAIFTSQERLVHRKTALSRENVIAVAVSAPPD